MKRTLLIVVILMALSLGTAFGASAQAQELKVTAAAPVVTTVQITPGNPGNYRHPGVAEDSKGNRLVIFRGTEGNLFYYSYCPKNGTWSLPTVIANGVQPLLVQSLYSYIEVDTSDRFHCYWENANAGVYATFKDGVWTTPGKVPSTGKYDLCSGMTVNVNDEVLVAACGVVGFSKDVYLIRKKKNDAAFLDPFNLSRDMGEASTQPHVAGDSLGHSWVVWKSDLHIAGVEENLVIWLSKFDGTTNADIGDWYLVSPRVGWSFVPQVAVNSEDKVMTLCSTSTMGDYISTFFDPATETLSELIPLGVGLVRAPWHTFFSRLVSHGKDFYAAVMDGARQLWLMKFDQATSTWVHFAPIGDRGAEQFALYSGYEHMIIAWNSMEEPTSVFVSTVQVDPFSKVKIKSASNLNVVKTVERGFFTSYTLNVLTWTANPENTEKGLTITAHRIYRKARTADDTEWVRITEVAGTTYSYNDRFISSDSDYVYTVTCVDDNEHESKVF